jgi:hypothetical protein
MMGLKERFQRTISMTVMQRQSMIIVTMLSILMLANIWPRFLADALSLDWYIYLILIILFAIPLYKRS